MPSPSFPLSPQTSSPPLAPLTRPPKSPVDAGYYNGSMATTTTNRATSPPTALDAGAGDSSKREKIKKKKNSSFFTSRSGRSRSKERRSSSNDRGSRGGVSDNRNNGKQRDGAENNRNRRNPERTQSSATEYAGAGEDDEPTSPEHPQQRPTLQTPSMEDLSSATAEFSEVNIAGDGGWFAAAARAAAVAQQHHQQHNPHGGNFQPNNAAFSTYGFPSPGTAWNSGQHFGQQPDQFPGGQQPFTSASDGVSATPSLGGYLSANADRRVGRDSTTPSGTPMTSTTTITSSAASAAGESKTCMPVFRRKSNKISSVDVASVGNASDTLVSLSSQKMSGRDLHEHAKTLFNAGDFDRALPLFEAILSAQVRRFTPLHASVGAAMHNVGVCRQRMGQDDLAENLFRESVQIREETLGKNHLEVAASLSKLGASLTTLSRLDEAYDTLRRALKIAKLNLGNEHKTVAQMLCHLGCFYFEAGELFSAQSTFEDALEIYRIVWRTSEARDACMSQLSDTLCNIGSIQNRRKRYSNAVESFSEALDLQRGILEHDDPRVVSTLDNLGYSYSKTKDYAAALSCYRKMLRAQISSSSSARKRDGGNGQFTQACFETFQKQILMFEKSKRYADAVEETKEVLQTQKKMLPRDHTIIKKTKKILEDLIPKANRNAAIASVVNGSDIAPSGSDTGATGGIAITVATTSSNRV